MMKIIILLALLCSCGSLFYHPHKKIYTTPDKYKLDYKEDKIRSSDGTELSLWVIKPKKKPIATLLFFHGNAENISTHFFQASWMTKYDIQIVIFDYRGYGLSKGEPVKKGIYLDAQAALKYTWKLHKKTKSSKKFIAYGQSLGGIIMPAALTQMSFQKDIDLVVLDSTFSSYQDIAFDKLTDIWLTFLISPLAYLLVGDHLASEDYLPKLKAKSFLVLHGSEDKVVPEKFGRKVFDLLPKEKSFKLFRGVRHIRGFALKSNQKWFINYLSNI